MIGIYKIENQINNKCYIGQSSNIERRWNAHLLAINNPNKAEYGYPLYLAIRKYGLENFNFTIIELCELETLNEKEMYWIEFYKSNYRDYGYNQTIGGNNPTYNKITPEELEEITNYLREGLSNPEIAVMFNTTDQTICDINTGRSRVRNIDYPIRPIKIKKEKPKIFIPDKMELCFAIKYNSFVEAGRIYGVTYKMVKSWVRQYKLPSNRKDLIEWYDKEMGIWVEPIHSSTKEAISMANEEIYLEFQSVRDCVTYMQGLTGGTEYNLRKGMMRALRKERQTYLGYTFDYL